MVRDISVSAFIAAFLSLSAVPAAAPAQTIPSDGGPEEAGTEPDTIIVTAQRREQRLQETPVAVTAIGGEALEDLAIEEVQDLGRIVPNLQLLPVTANPSTLQVGLRGGQEQTGGLIVSEPVVGIYVDDVYRARLQGSNSQLGDIERIEVLRGPQGHTLGAQQLLRRD